MSIPPNEFYTYDKQEKLIEKNEFWTHGNGKEELKRKHNFIYDKNGRVVQMILEDWLGTPKSRSFSRITYQGSDSFVNTIKSNLISGDTIEVFNVITNNNGTISENESGVIREFDSRGNLIKIVSHDTFTNVIRRKELYNYDDKNNLIRTISFDQDDQLSSVIDNYYDENGKLLLISENSLSESKRKFYNSKGENTKTENFSFHNAVGSHSITQYKYDDYGNRFQMKYINYNEGKIDTSVTNYQFIYDEKGNWIEERSYRGDSLMSIEKREIVYYSRPN